nr:WRKY53 [Phoebe bournei]
MEDQFNTTPVATDKDEPGIKPETGAGSAFSSPKRKLADPEADFHGNIRSRRAVEKRVVSVPIGDTEGAPPSDSWAWRKYGQKPIKGSPYPRGYYRCSSWKGCPARKQVERSNVDPTMLVITYACDHNHPWPISRNKPNPNPNSPAPAAAAAAAEPKPPVAFSSPADAEPAEKFADPETDSVLHATNDFGWFSDMASSSPTKDTLLESPICAGSDADDVEAVIFPMREEDESLFADLGELPGCSVVFRRGFYEQVEESGRCRLREAPCCGSTG